MTQGLFSSEEVAIEWGWEKKEHRSLLFCLFFFSISPTTVYRESRKLSGKQMKSGKPNSLLLLLFINLEFL